MAARETLQIKDLVAGETYAIQVRALGDGDDIGNSPWSLTLTAALSEDITAPGAVQSLDLVASGAAFRATWSQPTLDGDGGTLSDLKDYMVIWSQTSNGGNQYIQYTENTSATLTFEENQQELGTVADITVEVKARDYANNVTGTPPSDAVTNVAPTIFTGLTAAPDETGGTAIAVEWPQPSGSAPDGSDNGNDISFYEIYRDSKKIEDVAFSPGTMRYMDPDPRPGSHDYEVTAVDVYGNEYTSNSDSATPSYLTGADTIAPNPPAFPGGISGDFLTAGAVAESRTGTEAYIDVTFDAPIVNTDASDYTDNEGFLIKWNVDGSSDVFERFAVDSREDPPTDPVEITVRLNGLRTGVTYDVQVAAFDTSRNFSTYISGSETTPSDTTAPGQPSAPTASNDTQAVLVSHDLTLQAGGDLPVDVVALSVFADTSSGFTPSDANKIGDMPVVPGVAAVQKFSLPSPEASPGAGADTWYFKVIAVDAAGNESAASPETSATSDLIEGANILNATIDDAKINTLSANKLVAGTGIIQDLTITDNGSFTVAATGYMQSGNWDGTEGGNASSTGWWMGNSGLVINDGTVQAATLTTIDSNMVPFDYAAMPSYERWYENNVWTTGGVFPNPEIGTESGVWYRYGYQSLAWSPDTGGDNMLLGTTATDYNIPVGVNSDYVYSAYVYNNTAGAVSIQLQVKDSDGITTVGSSESIGAGAVERISMSYTTTGTATSVTIGFRQGSGSGAWLIDGVQFERVSVGTAPSFFTMPGGSTITGNSITTGQIESNSYDAGITGWQIDLSGDVEFRNGLFRGTIQATAGFIENDFTISGKLVIDRDDSTDGIWIGNDIVPGDTANWYGINYEGNLVDTDGLDPNNIWAIKDDGQVVFRVGSASKYLRWDSVSNTLSISGNLEGATGTFTGTITAQDGEIAGELTLSARLLVDRSDIFLPDFTIGRDVGTSGRDGIWLGNVYNSWWQDSGGREYFRAGNVSTYILYDSQRASEILIKGDVELIGNFDAGGATITGGQIIGGYFITPDVGTRVAIDSGSVEFFRENGTSAAELSYNDITDELTLDAKGSADGLILRGGYVWALAESGVIISAGGPSDAVFRVTPNSGGNGGELRMDYSTSQWQIDIGGTRELTLGQTGFLVPNVYNSNFGGGSTVYVDSGGQMHRNTSTLRYKTSVTEERGYTIDNLRPIKYKRIDIQKNKERVLSEDYLFGLAAEEVAEAIPEAAVYGPDGLVEDYNDRAVIAALVSEVQALKAEVASLRNQ